MAQNFKNQVLEANILQLEPRVTPLAGVSYSPTNGAIWYDTGSNALETVANGAIVQVTTTAVAPFLFTNLLAIDTNVTHSISGIAPSTSLYNIAIFMESYGDGAGGSTLVATITFTNVQGNVKTVTLTLLGPSDNIQQENYVLLAEVGTTISVSTAFSSTSFHYDIATSIVIIPT